METGKGTEGERKDAERKKGKGYGIDGRFGEGNGHWREGMEKARDGKRMETGEECHTGDNLLPDPTTFCRQCY